MKRMMLWPLLAVLLSTPVQAHLLKVFVYADGERLQGSVYFTGGVAAAGAQIRILGDNDALLAELSPDSQGEFGYTVSTRRDYRVVADTGDGHRAEWTVAADELVSDLSTAQAKLAAAPTVLGDEPSSTSNRSCSSLSDNELAALIERAVAAQVGPLRRELQAYGDRTRLADIVGGIGFIFGLAGTLLWWRSRR
ncbi:MAG: hypothetical protein V7752_18155 [Halopseudomonas sp.]